MQNINCINCGQPVAVFLGEPGEQVHCGNCGHSFAIPEQGQTTPIPQATQRPRAVPSPRSVAPAAQSRAAAPTPPTAAPLSPVPVASPYKPHPQRARSRSSQKNKWVLGISLGFVGLFVLLAIIGAISGTGSGGSSGATPTSSGITKEMYDKVRVGMPGYQVRSICGYNAKEGSQTVSSGPPYYTLSNQQTMTYQGQIPGSYAVFYLEGPFNAETLVHKTQIGLR